MLLEALEHQNAQLHAAVSIARVATAIAAIAVATAASSGAGRDEQMAKTVTAVTSAATLVAAQCMEPGSIMTSMAAAATLKARGSTFEAVRGLAVAMVAAATLGLHSTVVTAMLLLSSLSASYA